MRPSGDPSSPKRPRIGALGPFGVVPAAVAATGHLPARQHLPGRHDACYLPRKAFVTGNIQVHEMAWAGSEVWIVNTRFSCLCTLDGQHSFVPRWRPPFITALAAEDRCHLNGLGVRDGRVRVLDDPASYRPLGEAARRLMESRYSLDVCVPALKDYFERQANG